MNEMSLDHNQLQINATEINTDKKRSKRRKKNDIT